LTNWPGLRRWGHTAFTQQGLEHRYWADLTQCGSRHECWDILLKPNGELEYVLHEHSQRGWFMAPPESGEGIGRFVVWSEDMMELETIELFI
jgi:hypothetical protein